MGEQEIGANIKDNDTSKENKNGEMTCEETKRKREENGDKDTYREKISRRLDV